MPVSRIAFHTRPKSLWLIALGHPLGVLGAILLGNALEELERTGNAPALIKLCTGGGVGIVPSIGRAGLDADPGPAIGG